MYRIVVVAFNDLCALLLDELRCYDGLMHNGDLNDQPRARVYNHYCSEQILSPRNPWAAAHPSAPRSNPSSTVQHRLIIFNFMRSLSNFMSISPDGLGAGVAVRGLIRSGEKKLLLFRVPFGLLSVGNRRGSML